MITAPRCAATLILCALACGGHAPPAAPAVAPITTSWIEKAEAEERKRQHHQAREFYLRAKEVSPDDFSRAHAAARFAGTLLSWREFAPARRELIEATRLAPAVPGFWHNLAYAEANLGNRAGAEAALRRSIELAPRDPRSRLSLAELLWRQGRHAEAIAAYEALLTLELPERVRRAIVDSALPQLRAAGATGPGAAP